MGGTGARHDRYLQRGMGGAAAWHDRPLRWGIGGTAGRCSQATGGAAGPYGGARAAQVDGGKGRAPEEP
uniref:Uncharacterized protein n=1 Tax=Setaria viridis TaxID=4556 RepID=A0A4U6VJY8_SETVI|nr:hypothetical protein SEVIR_3G384650v2 [Setaria viridis]